ncbi:hypothetical protein V8C86DRAFT_3128706 [Haematococcus lacustris]
MGVLIVSCLKPITLHAGISGEAGAASEAGQHQAAGRWTLCDYGPKNVPYLRAHDPYSYEPNKAPFDSTTSHKADYQQRSAVAVVKAKGPGSSLATIQGPFEGVSLYKESFGQQLYARREPVLHSGGGGVLPDAARFDAVSLYSQTYLAVGADQRREQALAWEQPILGGQVLMPHPAASKPGPRIPWRAKRTKAERAAKATRLPRLPACQGYPACKPGKGNPACPLLPRQPPDRC